MSEPEKMTVIFKPIFISEKEIKKFDRRVLCHDDIQHAYIFGQHKEYYEYTFDPKTHGWTQPVERMLKNLSGLFDGITFWGYVKEIHKDHDEWYNVIFNHYHVERIGKQVRRDGEKTRKDYDVLYGMDGVIYGLQSIVHPFDFIFYDRAYSPNENASKDYKLALLSKTESKQEEHKQSLDDFSSELPF